MENGAEAFSSSAPHSEEIARESLLEAGSLATTEYNVDGARIAVDYAHIPLREGIQPEDKRDIAIYLPGLPSGPKSAYAGNPQEVGMIADVLTGKATDLVVMKPEGLTAEAFADGAAAEKSAALQKLMEICAEQGIDLQKKDGHSFSIYGYSEGGSQGVSLALELQRQFGTVSRFVGIEATGVVGYPDKAAAHVWPQTIDRLRQQFVSDESTLGLHGIKDRLSSLISGQKEKPVTKTDSGYHLSKELLDSYSEIFQHADKTPAQRREYTLKYLAASASNVLPFLRRLMLGAEVFKTPRGVKADRLRHTWTVNNDFSALAEAGVPMTLFSGKRSEVNSYEDMQGWVRNQRDAQRNVSWITSDTRHFDPSVISKGVGAALAFTEGKNRPSPKPSPTA